MLFTSFFKAVKGHNNPSNLQSPEYHNTSVYQLQVFFSQFYKNVRFSYP